MVCKGSRKGKGMGEHVLTIIVIARIFFFFSVATTTLLYEMP